MKNFIFSSERQEKKFMAFKAGVERVLNLKDKDLYKSEIGRVNELILFCVRSCSAINKENIKMTAQIVKKFLEASEEIRKEKEKGKNRLFSAKVFMLLKSFLRPPKKNAQGKKRSVVLSQEEINFLHGSRDK